MRHFLLFRFAPFVLLPFATAQNGTGSCCKFTISAQPDFPQPAGQLPDGQIRFNGSYPTSTFCLDKNGGITDGSGFGCIVTGPPTTQIQCDQGKTPTTGFAVGPNNSLMYHNSTNFFACPATDTEYNIYVSPDFGQTKCFPIKLTTSGCGTTTSTCPPPITIWQREWVTEMIPISVTYTYITTMSGNFSSTASSTATEGNSTLSSTSGSSLSSTAGNAPITMLSS